MNLTLHDLRERLIQAEQQFLLAVLASDEESLEKHSQTFSQLVDHFKTTTTHRELDDDTALLFFRTSKAIESMADCILQSRAILLDAQTCVMSTLTHNLQMEEDPRFHPPATISDILFCRFSPSAPGIVIQHRVLSTCAHRWLMQNIHNPYPTPVQMQILGDASGTSMAQVELWFQEVRESIGWTKLSQDFFGSSVDATVAAAKQVYMECDKGVPFSIAFAFTAVKASAELLFLEHPALQEKQIDSSHPARISQSALSPQEHRLQGSSDNIVADPDSVSVLQDKPSTLSTNLPCFSESEEEDTTPPPSVAGCKRSLSEDGPILQSSNSERPFKRSRTWSIPETFLSESDRVLSQVSMSAPFFKQSTVSTYTEALTRPTTPFPSPFCSQSIISGMSPYNQLIPAKCKRKEAGFNSDISEEGRSLLDTQIPPCAARKRRLLESDSLVPSKRPRNMSTRPQQSIALNSSPAADTCLPLSPFGEAPVLYNESSTSLYPMSQVSIDSGTPVDLGIFDWNTISGPSMKTALLMLPTAQPSYIYVPATGLLPALNPEVPITPNIGQHATANSNPSYSLGDLGSLEDLSTLLQFPIQIPCPDPSTSSPTSFSESPSLPLQDIDWSSITELIGQSSPATVQSSFQSSPLAPSVSIPSTPGDVTDLPTPPSLTYDGSKPTSTLDSSVPPSVFLPVQPEAFAGGEHDLWSLLCGELS